MTKIPPDWLNFLTKSHAVSYTHLDVYKRQVRDYVMNNDTAKQFLTKLTDMVEFLIPNYISEGKTQLVIGIGCTGGKHRSVTLANELYEALKKTDSYGAVSYTHLLLFQTYGIMDMFLFYRLECISHV